jgi:hypothetical protein
MRRLLALGVLWFVSVGCAGDAAPGSATRSASDTDSATPASVSPSPSASTPRGDDRVRLVEAANATLDAGSFALRIKATFAEKNSTDWIRLDGEGAIDLVQQRGQIRMRVTLLPAEGDPVSDWMEFRFLDDSLYIRPPAVDEPYATPWVRVSLTEPPPEAADLLALADTNYTLDLALLRGAHDVDNHGARTVRDVRLTRYAASLNVEDAIAAASPGERSLLRERVAGMPADVDAVVLLDDEGRVRSMDLDFDGAEADAADVPFTVANMILEYSEFGRDVKVTAPPDAHVTDLGDLLESPQPDPSTEVQV